MQPAHSTPARRQRQSLPFAAIPHALADDPRLTVLDLAVVRVLLKYARDLDRCWVLVAIIAAAVRRGRRSVQLSLRRLEAAGWLAAEPAPNRAGRCLVLTWRCAPNTQCDAHPAPQPAAPEQDAGVGRENDSTASERPREEPADPAPVLAPAPATAPAPAAARPGFLAADLAAVVAAASDPVLARELARLTAPRPAPPPPPTTFDELIARLREHPGHVPKLADALATALSDRKSFAGYLARCKDAWEGRLDPGDLAEAFAIARKPGARNPGAVFMAILKRAARPARRC